MVVPLFWRIEMEGIVAKIWNIKEGTMGRGAAVQITDSISYITNSEKCDGVIVNDDFMQVGREVSYVIMILKRYRDCMLEDGIFRIYKMQRMK